MKTYATKLTVVSTAVALAAISSLTFAGTIANSPAPTSSGPGLGLVSVPAIVTLNPNNDNQTGGGPNDNNVVIPLKRFDFNGYIDIVFPVAISDGVTEYKVTEFVDNSTGTGWSSYTMQLGSGTGANFTPFVSGNLTFDAPNYDSTPTTTGPLTTIAKTPYQLTFSGGVQGVSAQQYSFRLDIPDTATGGPGNFTIRQIPTAVPEPASMALVGLALAGLFGVGRKR